MGDVDNSSIGFHKRNSLRCLYLATFHPEQVHRVFGLEQKTLADRIADSRVGSNCGVEKDQSLGGESSVKVGRLQIEKG